MSLNLKVGIKDLSISRYDPQTPEKWREDTLSVVATLGVDHMLSGEYTVKTRGSEDPYLAFHKREQKTKVEELRSTPFRRVSQSSKVGQSPDSSHPIEADQSPQYPRDQKAEDGSDDDVESIARDDVSVTKASDIYTDFEVPNQHAANAGVLGKKYARALLEKGLNKRRYFVRIIDGRHYDEPHEERKKRIALWGLMSKSVKHLPYMLTGIDEHDVQSLWDKVCTNAQPNERELMVTYITQLVDHKKENDCGFETWHSKYLDMLEHLSTVGFTLPELAKLGFLFYLLKGDRRFNGVIEKCKDNNWNYPTCVAKITQKATEIGDTKVPLTARRQRVNQIDTQVQRGQGGNRSRKERRKPPANAKSIDCKNPNCTFGDRCWYRHKPSTKDPSKSPSHTSPKGGGPSGGTKSGPTKKDADKECFVWRDTKDCPQGDRCRFKHSSAAMRLLVNWRSLKEASDCTGATITVGETVELAEASRKTFPGFAGRKASVVSMYSTVQNCKPRHYCKMQLWQEDDKPLEGVALQREEDMYEYLLEHGLPAAALSIVGKGPTHGVNGSERSEASRGIKANAMVDGGASLNVIYTDEFFVGEITDQTVGVQSPGDSSWGTKGKGVILMYSNIDSKKSFAVEWHYAPINAKDRTSYFSPTYMAAKHGWSCESRPDAAYIRDAEGDLIFKVPRGRDTEDENGDLVPGFYVLPEEVFRPRQPSGTSAIRCGAIVKHRLGKARAVGKTNGVAHRLANVSVASFTRDMTEEMDKVLSLHDKLGHPSMEMIFFILGIKDKSLLEQMRDLCTSCQISKLTNKPVGKAALAKASRRNFRVFGDNCGPFIESAGPGYKHFLRLVDEHTSRGVTLLLKQRSEAPKLIQWWIEQQNRKHPNEKVVELRLDGAPEFKSNAMKAWAIEEGIDLQVGLPYAHHHQSKVERSHRTVQESGRAMRHRAGMPKEYWPWAILHASYLADLLPSTEGNAQSALQRG